MLLTNKRISSQNFLFSVLSPLTTNEFTVKDSFAFAKEITKADSNYFMASLDVKSLFTNILLKERIENCFLITLKLKILPRKMFVFYCQLQQKNCFLIFDNSFCRQID